MNERSEFLHPERSSDNPSWDIITGMEINGVGVVSAISALLGIAFGHVVVRWLEFHIERLWLAILAFVWGGFVLEGLSLAVNPLYLKISLGIWGMTLLWDAIELFRQQRRVQRGHAPANPGNPRHRRFLDDPSLSATPVDRLRDEFPSLDG